MKSDFFFGGGEGKALVSAKGIYPVSVLCVGGQSPELAYLARISSFINSAQKLNELPEKAHQFAR